MIGDSREYELISDALLLLVERNEVAGADPILEVGGACDTLGEDAVVRHGSSEIFVSMRPFGRVLAVLLPGIVYVGLIGGVTIGPLEVPKLGIYVASAIFIFAFMLAVGRENVFKAGGVSVLVPLALFFMFERWFLVPLPKGPLEAWLGY